ncbi:hypothetical protein NQ314_018643 [Rhamnusium bicolor]|uniref:Uncharacterized protein n=1 Tax=Rhamnusium bicolor TaxID=1586634 RepID=A0AAV8WR82_9CUCU|nr:hypothetical protein NQ314_018643 [Rhamnusium bicolor]
MIQNTDPEIDFETQANYLGVQDHACVNTENHYYRTPQKTEHEYNIKFVIIISAHQNVKVFITHGGLLSTTETIYHGVPIIAIPIFGDQKMNAITAQDEGYAIVLPFQEISEEKLTSYLNEIITNPQYRENVKERSRIMKDRQIKPLDNAVYWVEYVIRHNGAKHLRVPYLDLTWYQYYLLDVLGFIFVVLFALVVLLRKIFRYICCRRVVKTKLKEN